MTRDHAIWIWGRVVAIVLALGALPVESMTVMGIPPAWRPYLALAAFLVGIVSGTLGNSPLRGEHDRPV